MNHEGWSYRYERVKCGKSRCGSCPHGPYWYRYRRAGRRVEKEYVGRRAPWQPASPGPEPAPPPDPREPLLEKGCRDTGLARRVLGIGPDAGQDEARLAFHRLCRAHHPDRGGSAREFSLASAAYEVLIRVYGWRTR